MANSEDLDLLRSGEADLSDCDFSGANLSNLNLSGRKFDRSKFTNADLSGSDLTDAVLTRTTLLGANFQGARLPGVRIGGALNRLNFIGADLRNAIFTGVISRSRFDKADIRGANFSKVMFREDCSFHDAITDESTIFEGAQTSRSIARLPIFSAYDLIDGVLRLRSGPRSPSEPADQTSETGADIQLPLPNIPEDTAWNSNESTNILSKPQVASEIGRGMSERISTELARLSNNIPNEPSALDAHERYVELLEYMQSEIVKVIEILSTEDGGNARIQAKSVLEGLAGTITNWAAENGERTVRYGVDVTMLAVGITFLASCGVTSLFSFPVLVAILCGKDVAALINKGGAE